MEVFSQSSALVCPLLTKWLIVLSEVLEQWAYSGIFIIIIIIIKPLFNQEGLIEI